MLPGNIFCTGSFQNTTDFDPGSGMFNVVSSGGEDIFVLKLNPIATVGITKNIYSEKIQVYPNPTTTQLTIKTDGKLIGANFSVINITGQTVLSGKIAYDNTLLKVEDLPSGIYLFRVKSKNGNRVSRFVKE